MKQHTQRALSIVAITIALCSLPISVFVSGRSRNHEQHDLCVFALHQWHASDLTILRFTAHGSTDRHDALVILGPKPSC